MSLIFESVICPLIRDEYLPPLKRSAKGATVRRYEVKSNEKGHCPVLESQMNSLNLSSLS